MNIDKNLGKYEWTLKILRYMDESQIIELFEDMDSIEAVSKIRYVAETFLAQKRIEMMSFYPQFNEEKENLNYDNKLRANDINRSIS